MPSRGRQVATATGVADGMRAGLGAAILRDLLRYSRRRSLSALVLVLACLLPLLASMQRSWQVIVNMRSAWQEAWILLEPG